MVFTFKGLTKKTKKAELTIYNELYEFISTLMRLMWQKLCPTDVSRSYWQLPNQREIAIKLAAKIILNTHTHFDV